MEYASVRDFAERHNVWKRERAWEEETPVQVNRMKKGWGIAYEV